jgi:hypothetical protein
MGTTTQIDPEVTVALQGTLDTFALPDVLRLLAATKKTGRLRLSGERGSGSLWVDAGAISAIEATHAPHATEPVDALFELLRFDHGSFTFDADAVHGEPGPAEDVEELLQAAEALLAEWRQIESVVPSLDAWVTLRRELAAPELTIDQARWTTLVAVGGGATVRRMADDLCLAELPVSRAVRDLAELGVVDIAPAAPAGRAEPRPTTQAPAPVVPDPVDAEPQAQPTATAPVDAALDAPDPTAAVSTTVDAGDDAPLPSARPLRARRAGPRVVETEASSGPEVFVPLELPRQEAASYDPIEELDDEGRIEDEVGDEATAEDTEGLAIDDLAAAFPGLANRSAAPTPEDEELARQLATLSPRAAEAVRAAAEATTVEERDAALDAVEGEEQPINRGLLLKFLSSVKG